MFYRVSIHCTHCDAEIASTNVVGWRIPGVVLRRMAVAKGAVTDHGTRWYCDRSCRTKFRLKHDTSHRETPDVD